MKMDTAISIVVNGEKRETSPGATVADLLVVLGLDSGRAAIERNPGNPSAPRLTQTSVEPGDRYEIVQFVGGG
jgi:thiamine biosynthesis protein ThiS